ncbi:MAG: hypothetical protein WAT70_13050 [Rhizobiaceae bacterium]
MNNTLKIAAAGLAGIIAATSFATVASANPGDGWKQPKVIVDTDDMWRKKKLPRPFDGNHGGAFDDFEHRRHGDRHHGPVIIFRTERSFVKVARCSVDDAVWKASSRYGLRRVQVEFANRHVIGVTGKKNGHWRDLVFARSPGCPLVSR